jgi:hypothetical protein
LARPTILGRLDDAGPNQAAVYFPAFFAGFQEWFADSFPLFLVVMGLHFVEGAQALGGIQEGMVHVGRFAVQTPPSFPVSGRQPAQAKGH